MIDKATDMSNTEQLALVLRWISADLTASEVFMGLYFLSSEDAHITLDVMTNAFLRIQIQIPLAKLCGQCYDGCSTMANGRLV